MKLLVTTLLLCCTVPAFEQDYPFVKDFVDGIIILKDSVQKTGQIKWFPSQNERLKYRADQHAAVEKYSPDDLIGFNTDTLRFFSVFNFEAYTGDYALLGKTSKIKHSFGQLLDSGSFNIYLVLIDGYNALSGGAQAYPNFLFERKSDSGNQYAAYPFAIRMKDKRYEDAKEDLYIFFKDYPVLIEKLRSYKKEDDFFEIINLMKTLN